MPRLRSNQLKPHQREKMKPRMKVDKMMKLQLKKVKKVKKNMMTKKKLQAPLHNHKEVRSMSMRIVRTMRQKPKLFSRMILMSSTLISLSRLSTSIYGSSLTT